MNSASRLRVCFVTGTRAEFGLMESSLRAIGRHSSLQLQIAVTGMHLDRAHGRSIDTIRKAGWKIDAVVAWPRATTPAASARRTGNAMAGLSAAFSRLRTDVVLVVGDRVEAFAAAAAGHVGGCVVAHIHGGDRALGQVDDALRHAITKLAHVHFPATTASAARIKRMGEDAWRIHRVGAPGIDGICDAACTRDALIAAFPALEPRQFALLALHPASQNEAAEQRVAETVLRSTLKAGLPRVVIIHPNNDPGGRGISRAWSAAAGDGRIVIRKDVPRSLFLGLLREAALLVGNSSSGIIEAASFGTPVVDVGRRQAGRERSANVVNVPAKPDAIRSAVAQAWRKGNFRKFSGRNVYGDGSRVGGRIADVLSRLSVDDRLRRKLIAY